MEKEKKLDINKEDITEVKEMLKEEPASKEKSILNWALNALEKHINKNIEEEEK